MTVLNYFRRRSASTNENNNQNKSKARFSMRRVSSSSTKHPFRIVVSAPQQNAQDVAPPTGAAIKGSVVRSDAKHRFVVTPKKLGSGAYGAVLLGNSATTFEEVAIKLVADGRMKPVSLEREVRVLRRLSDHGHPSHLKFHAYVPPHAVKAGEIISAATGGAILPLAAKLGQCHAMVTELVRGGELFAHVLNVDGLAGHEAQSAPIFAQICDAVHAAHSLGIVHRDLKLENVLLVEGSAGLETDGAAAGGGQPMRIKLIDWGLAYLHAMGADGSPVPEKLYSRSGSRSYMAPEVTNKDISAVIGYNGFAADVWSLGVCLFAMHLGFFPFEQANPLVDWRARRVVEAQAVGASTMATILSFYPKMECTLSPSLLALLDRMLVFDPVRRATLPEVLGSEWLAPHVATCCSAHRLRLSAQVTATASDSTTHTQGDAGERTRGSSDSSDAGPEGARMGMGVALGGTASVALGASSSPTLVYTPRGSPELEPVPAPASPREEGARSPASGGRPSDARLTESIFLATPHAGRCSKAEGQLSPGKHARSISKGASAEQHGGTSMAVSVARLLSKTCKLTLGGSPRRPSAGSLSSWDALASVEGEGRVVQPVVNRL